MPPRSKTYRYDKKLDEVVEVKKKAVRKTKAKWPIVSDAAGVAPSQVGEARRKFADLGLKEHCEAVGLYDRNGGYGDPQRNRSIEGGESQGLFS